MSAKWIGKFFEPDTWDGSDIFSPAESFHPSIFVTDRVKAALERARLKNVLLCRLDPMERSDLALKTFPQG